MAGWDGTIATLVSFAPPPGVPAWGGYNGSGSGATSFSASDEDPYNPSSQIIFGSDGNIQHRRTTGAGTFTSNSASWWSDAPDPGVGSLYQVRATYNAGASADPEHPAGGLDMGRGVWVDLDSGATLHNSGGVAVNNTDENVFDIDIRDKATMTIQFTQQITVRLTKETR